MTTASHHAHDFHVTRDHVRSASMGMGVVFLLVGILGFIPGITTQYGSMTFASGSEAMLLGAFQVSVLLNLLYLAMGAAGVWMSRGVLSARNFLLGSGAVLLVMWLYGLIVGTSAANILSTNASTNWLNLILGVVAGGLGVAYAMRHRGSRAV
ncbi:hypothetical protein ASH00_15275 [Arthrobacter sp. Soil782]|uniref:DUF4383 domain-containing protein n=1 Tax=Arthrobacter sp. Soil782 TaxID=1736410 RepID=UPI0006F9B159|nr:DUF4383 domain-containing protein [Arthrobacter sp. Soil782]KRF04011.1 hypothetical protein ASH00_15275 [Arthrobacter sp. Soil782]